MPSTGSWIANLVLDTSDTTGFADNDPVTIEDSNGLFFSGTVVPRRTGLFIETLHVRVIGGRGGMGKPTQARTFSRAVVRDVINALLADSGEILSPTVDSSLLATFVGNWNIYSDTVAAALDKFLSSIDPDLNWRIQPDSRLWIGVETFPITTVDYQLLETNPVEQIYTLGISNLTFAQGISIDGVGKVSRIEYQILPASIRAQVWTDINGGRGFLPDMQAMVEYFTDKMKYYGTYLGNVTAQSEDWTTVDITSTNSKVPSMSKVPLLSGQYEAVSGMQVMFGWQGGDPSQPYAISFINNSGAAALALAQQTNTNFSTFKTDYDGHTHPFVATGASSPTSAPTNPMSDPSDVSTQKVKGT